MMMSLMVVVIACMVLVHGAVTNYIYFLKRLKIIFPAK